MRRLAAAAFFVSVLVPIGILSTGGPSADIVVNRYGALVGFEAEGWLPQDILPPSTRAILTEHNLDTHVPHGHFAFDPSDALVFLVKIKTSPPSGSYDSKRASSARADTIDRLRRPDLSTRRHSDGGSEWALSCDPHMAYCDDRMWPIL